MYFRSPETIKRKLKLDIKKLIIEAIKDQQEVFGDELFEHVEIKVKEKYLVSEPRQEAVAEKKVELMTDKLFQEDFKKSKNLEELFDKIHKCTKCPLSETRTNFVFGVGNPTADVMLIGEAPGAEEDKQGEPFVGRAGKLLTDILKAINFTREEVYIANILKCRPPNNRDPLPSEVEKCKPHLMKQIELIKPKVILCLGRIAAIELLNKKLTLSKLREEVHELDGIKVMATYHPAALLRNPNWKRGCWEDVQKFRKLYDDLTGKK